MSVGASTFVFIAQWETKRLIDISADPGLLVPKFRSIGEACFDSRIDSLLCRETCFFKEYHYACTVSVRNF